MLSFQNKGDDDEWFFFQFNKISCQTKERN